ncbi:probable cytochrome P450 9f2 [Culicoides brevitarsis]|uniref:probable cytochrome P450 9f2 n=1 Tax=Culicoides brevitarsis TaxID=469753 RepID=UPI00307BABC2
MSLFTWFCLIFPIILLFYFYVKRKYSYFEERNVPFVKPVPLIGNMFLPVLKGESIVEAFVKLATEFRNEPFIGSFEFLSPGLIIQDPEIIKQVTVKNFDNFVNHRVFTDSVSDELLNNSLLLMKFQKWRDMRAALSPAFTGLKMRMMFDLMKKCAENFVTYGREQCAKEKNRRVTINPKEIYSKVTVDIISTCAFGLEVDSLRHSDNEMYINAQRLSNMANVWLALKFIVLSVAPKLGKWLDLTILPKETGKFFKHLIGKTISFRKENNFYRPDILQLLIEAKDGKLKFESDQVADEVGFATIDESDVGRREVKLEWTDTEITAQCLIFFLGGFETVSTLMNFASYELAIDTTIQDKLYREIKHTNDMLNGGPITYDILMKLPYLDAFICELLRKHPGQPGFDRVCNEETLIESDDGKKFTIPKGMVIFVNMFGMHYNPKYFPNPEKFDPERFLGENKKNIKPYTYMPFALGPRACIGSRFALMQAKLLLYHVVLNFEIGIGPKMCIPFRYKKGFKIEPEGCVVDLIERQA